MNLFSLEDQINEIALPELGDRVSGAVSASEEKAIGEMFLQQVYSQAPLISDPLLFEYTEHLIYRLSEYSQVKDRYFNILFILLHSTLTLTPLEPGFVVSPPTSIIFDPDANI